MEKHLETINILNKTLNKEKEEIRKKLYEKILDKLYIELECVEEDLFEKSSRLFKDEEYENLRKKYIKLNKLTSSIYYSLRDF